MAALWMKAEPKVSYVDAVVDAWTGNEDLSSPGGRESRVREAFVGISGSVGDLRLGRQILVWGRADQINPTDNLTPRDFTLLVPEPADERIGTAAALAVHRQGDYSVFAVWLPRFRPNVVPLPVGQGVRNDLPGNARQLALKLDRSGGGGIDWSVSWFSGFDLNPTLGPDPAAPGGLLARHPRVTVLGADFALPVGRFGIRGEAAFTRTEDRDGTDPLKKNSFFFGVFGVERTFFDYLNINVQYYTYFVRQFRDPRELPDSQLRALAIAQAIEGHQLDRREQGVALRVSNKWWNETLNAEVAVIAGFERRDYAVKPKLVYAISDHLTGTLGADLLRGSAISFFGTLRRNSVAYAELRYVF